MVMRVTVGMIMSMVCVAKCQNTNYVDEKTHDADSHEFVQSLNVGAFRQTLDGFIYDLNTDQPRSMSVGNDLNVRCCLHQKDSIGKPSQGLNLGVTIRKSRAGWPFAHYCSAETNY